MFHSKSNLVDAAGARSAISNFALRLIIAAAVVAGTACSGSDKKAPDGPEFSFGPQVTGYNWPSCDSVDSAKKLAGKAEYFDRVARERHIAGDGLLRNLILTEDLMQVEKWLHVENVILWSGMYLASQAFRYRVTANPEALDNARIVVAALGELTAVTGVRGLYGRSMFNPGVSYNEVDPNSPGWTDSPVEGYEGWRYRNDVSKDGYDGLMFGYAAALDHFDDPKLLETIRGRVWDIVDHLMENGLQIIDADGKVTEHGRLFHSALDDFPGFNAMLASSWIKVAAGALGDSELDDFYYGCLMQSRADVDCPKIENSDFGSYIESMETSTYLFLPNCQQNYDNFDMCYQAIYPLLSREVDESLRARLLGVLRNNMFHTEDPQYQSIAEIGNSLFTFIYAALEGSGPDDDPVLKAAVDDAVCTLKRFPDEKYERYIPAGAQESVCQNRLAGATSETIIPLDQYHFDNYLWRLDFFEIQPERPENRRMVYSPEDFLVAYWLGRYHALISDDL